MNNNPTELTEKIRIELACHSRNDRLSGISFDRETETAERIDNLIKQHYAIEVREAVGKIEGHTNELDAFAELGGLLDRDIVLKATEEVFK